MTYQHDEWVRVDLPRLAARGQLCSAKLALDALERYRADIDELASALQMLSGDCHVLAKRLRAEGNDGSASIVEHDIGTAKRIIDKVLLQREITDGR